MSDLPTCGFVVRSVAGMVCACLQVHAARAQDAPPLPALKPAGAVIGEIHIDAKNIFDLNDPRENKALYRLANALHIGTREHVIRDQLLFRSGDPYELRTLAESERILRSTRYLYDASIEPVAWHDGVVDVAVKTRDVWTLNPGFSFGRRGGNNNVGFEIEELNLLGTGTAISVAHESATDRDSDILKFSDRHLGDSWVSLSTAYANNSDGSTKELSLQRPFYSLNAAWAAGFDGRDDERIHPLYDQGRVIDRFRAHDQRVTVFGGRSLGRMNGWVRRWQVGATRDTATFDIDPEWAGASVLPQDRKFVYPWIGFELIQDDFEKDKNMDQIGRTEDFHLGTHISAKVGWADTAFGSNRDALLFDATASYGMRTASQSLLLFDATTTGRLERGDLTNAAVTGSMKYYRQQSPRRLFFMTAEATFGERLDLDNQILLGGDNGLRGYPLRYQAGTARALLTLEQRYFTDWYPFRLFRVGGAIFCDVGRTWGHAPPAQSGTSLLKDIGAGLRIGNSRSGLGNVIHIDVAFPLDGDSSIKNVQFLVETRQRF